MNQIMSGFLPRSGAGVSTPPEISTPDAGSSSDLEARIDHQAMLLHTAPTPDERRVAWGELTRLHALRPPRRIAEMEREAGLR